MLTSYRLRQPAAPSAIARLLSLTAVLPVIDVPELRVVLKNRAVVFGQLQGPVVRLSGLAELAELFVRDREVVPCGGIVLVHVRRLFPSNQGFFPEPLLRDSDAEFDLRLRVGVVVGHDRPDPRQNQSHGEPAFLSHRSGRALLYRRTSRAAIR